MGLRIRLVLAILHRRHRQLVPGDLRVQLVLVLPAPQLDRSLPAPPAVPEDLRVRLVLVVLLVLGGLRARLGLVALLALLALPARLVLLALPDR